MLRSFPISTSKIFYETSYFGHQARVRWKTAMEIIERKVSRYFRCVCVDSTRFRVEESVFFCVSRRIPTNTRNSSTRILPVERRIESFGTVYPRVSVIRGEVSKYNGSSNKAGRLGKPTLCVVENPCKICTSLRISNVIHMYNTWSVIDRKFRFVLYVISYCSYFKNQLEDSSDRKKYPFVHVYDENYVRVVVILWTPFDEYTRIVIVAHLLRTITIAYPN